MAKKAIRTGSVDAMEMISIRTKWANGLSTFFACILSLMILINPAFSQEIVLSMHENYTLENCTLQVEDIDSQAAKVWVLIHCESRPSLSMVLGINDTLSCGKLTLTVTRIYAGESFDLVWVNATAND
jgi:hypothetical protein